MKLLKGKTYKFEWSDTYGNHGWFDEMDIDKNTVSGPSQISIGFFVKERAEWYIIAKHKNIQKTFAPWGDICWIPKGSVKKVTILG